MKHTIKLQPFTVPNYVRAECSPSSLNTKTEPTVYPLADLSVETLEELCVEFRKSVFEKAGKPLPL